MRYHAIALIYAILTVPTPAVSSGFSVSIGAAALAAANSAAGSNRRVDLPRQRKTHITQYMSCNFHENDRDPVPCVLLSIGADLVNSELEVAVKVKPERTFSIRIDAKSIKAAAMADPKKTLSGWVGPLTVKSTRWGVEEWDLPNGGRCESGNGLECRWVRDGAPFLLSIKGI